jgi:hypothetical protein
MRPTNAVAAAMVALLGLAGCASPPSAADRSTPVVATAAPANTREGVRAQFAAIAADRAALDRLVGARYPQLAGRKRELMVDQTAAMFASPQFADRVYDFVAPKMQGRNAMPHGAQAAFQAELRDQAAALGMQLSLKGMTRLGTGDQERFVRHAIGLHRSVDAATCRALIDGKLPATRQQEIELRYTAARSDDEFAQSLALGRRAMQAELSDAPPVPKLTQAQVDAAQKAWGRAILARGKAPADKGRFDRVRANAAEASDADTCWVTLQYLEAMLDLKGAERQWQLQSYMLDTVSEQ